MKNLGKAKENPKMDYRRKFSTKNKLCGQTPKAKRLVIVVSKKPRVGSSTIINTSREMSARIKIVELRNEEHHGEWVGTKYFEPKNPFF